ncbi:hypothetical protein NLJ89_g8753 [Agrocybe chaxingu]|uniref:Uncharacterized protein n=1 Tax=Agrocybe chaxingu TaxID=84603 RepID=A0A9W8MQH8_9AGAR|nr:hypothetical protein NLJ89_g8753 [Agrocybe chaxingu]
MSSVVDWQVERFSMLKNWNPVLLHIFEADVEAFETRRSDDVKYRNSVGGRMRSRMLSVAGQPQLAGHEGGSSPNVLKQQEAVRRLSKASANMPGGRYAAQAQQISPPNPQATLVDDFHCHVFEETAKNERRWSEFIDVDQGLRVATTSVNISAKTSNGRSYAVDVLDPTHPGLKSLKHLPHTRDDAIGVKIFPISLLNKPQLTNGYPFGRKFLTWTKRVQKAKEAGVKVVYVGGKPALAWNSGVLVGEDEQVYPEHDHNTLDIPDCKTTPKGPLLDIARKRAMRRVPMSYLTATSKARMGAKRYTRCQITRHMKVALNLIVTRGAYFGDPALRNDGPAKEDVKPLGAEIKPKHVVMRFDEEEARSMGRKWIMQGWSYIWFPTMEVYRMPYSQLIPRLRQMLIFLKQRANELEKSWFINALRNDGRPNHFQSRTNGKYPVPPPQTNSRHDPQQPQGSNVEEQQPRLPERLEVPVKPKLPVSKPKAIQPATAPKKVVTTFNNDKWKKELMDGLALLQRSTAAAEHRARRGQKAVGTRGT